MLSLYSHNIFDQIVTITVVHFVTTRLTYKWWVVTTVRPSPVAVRSPPNFHCRCTDQPWPRPPSPDITLWSATNSLEFTGYQTRANDHQGLITHKSDNISKSDVSTSLHCPSSRHCIHRLADHSEPPQIGPQNELAKHPKHVSRKISEIYFWNKLWLFKPVFIWIFSIFSH